MKERTALWSKYTFGLGSLALLSALGGRLVLGETKLWMEITGAAGILLLALTALLRPTELKTALTGRQARYGGNAFLMSISFLLILGLVNYLGVKHHYRWDVTEEKRFSLSEQTLQILKSLKEPVHVKLFFTPGYYNRQQAEDLIKEYAARCDKITYEFIDPDVQRRLAMQYQITRDGTTVFEQGDRQEKTYGVQEQDFTSALLKVTSDKVKGIYFLTGHQERDPESANATGYSLIKQLLQRENYKVGTFNFAVTDTLPSDLSVLIIAGPRKELSAEETERIRNYVEKGGSLFVLVDPGMPDPFNGALESFGIELPDDLIIDPIRSFLDISTPLVDRYNFHQITKDLAGLTSFFPTARSIGKVNPTPEGWIFQYLVMSSSDSWAELQYKEKRIRKDENEKKGPLGIAAVIEPSVPGSQKGRIVIVGDSDFVSNELLTRVKGSIGNADLFMNAVGWLAEEEELISIRPKPPEQRQIILTPPQARAVIYSNILFVPLAVLIIGGIVWWKRR
ncbi:MAG: GldG family protein [Anaerolineae bacterium]|nr:GldG family protein [Anaerolineae bacterium]